MQLQVVALLFIFAVGVFMVGFAFGRESGWLEPAGVLYKADLADGIGLAEGDHLNAEEPPAFLRKSQAHPVKRR